jgi:OmcA/MtrC family decaheme c-type cytochrome
VDLPHMAHALHSPNVRLASVCAAPPFNGSLNRERQCEDAQGAVIPGFVAADYEYVVYGHNDSQHAYGDLRYPQDVLSCETCHDTDKSADGGLWNENYTAEACGACHLGNLVVSDPDPTTGLSTYAIQHAFPSQPQVNGTCVNCHGADVAPTNLKAHSNIARSTRLRLALGEQFKFEILAADMTVSPPVVTIKVSNPLDETVYDIINDPEFTGGEASLNLYIAWTTDDIYNGDENGNVLGKNSDGCQVGVGIPDVCRALPPGYPLRMTLDAIQANATENADGSFDVTYFTSLPSVPGNPMIGMDGHPDVGGERAYAESTVFFPGPERPALVDNAKCNSCHGKLNMHGGNRNLGDYRICLACHNNDLSHFEHVSVDDEDPHLQIGDFFDSVSLGVLVHNLHIGSPTYFAGEFADVALPIAARLDLCEVCHIPGTYNGPRDTARAISIFEGADPTVWTDDIADSPWAGICTNCHTSLAAENHMMLNGGVLGGDIDVDAAGDPVKGTGFPTKDLFTAGTGRPIFSLEGCAVCHKAGGIADVAEAHRSVLPPDTGGH